MAHIPRIYDFRHVYGSGSTATVSATADPGWDFDHWILNGKDAGSTIPINVLMDSDHTLHAIFKEIPSPPSPPPVGGHAIPIDISHLLTPKIGLTPEIGLASVLLAAMAVTIILIRRRNKKLKRER